MEKKVRFRDLSVPLKIAIIMAWIMGMIWAFVFVVAMIQEILLWGI